MPDDGPGVVYAWMPSPSPCRRAAGWMPASGHYQETMNIRIVRNGVAVIGVAWLACCTLRTPAEAEKYEQVLRDMPAGTPVPVGTLFNRRFDRVCMLGPYVDQFHDAPEAGAVNPYLKQVEYVGSEDQWSLLWFDHDRLSLTAFDRESDMDVLASLGADVAGVMPDAFESVLCIEGEKAHILKVSKGRDYFDLVAKK
jgi:hypothetical protein